MSENAPRNVYAASLDTNNARGLNQLEHAFRSDLTFLYQIISSNNSNQLPPEYRNVLGYLEYISRLNVPYETVVGYEPHDAYGYSPSQLLIVCEFPP